MCRTMGIDMAGLLAPHSLETQNMAPSALAATRPLPPPRGTSPQPSAIADFFEPRPLSNPSDFERAADDIIANFRARHGVGLDSREAVQRLDDTYGKYSSSLRREASVSSAAATAGDTKAALTSARTTTLSARESTATAEEETAQTSSSSRLPNLYLSWGYMGGKGVRPHFASAMG
ncbi:uncharacterized protein LOC135197219 isoform X4 [Macrobrachium nipponense]|uniref:uncharacterized protein LOC135197219 isoform X4 n=1 Tax=Macrobrachium nipponense TaxID=159736 RepID=UPI0030C8789B